MKTISSIAITLVAVLGTSCATSELEGDCLEYKTVPRIFEKCTRTLPPNRQRICVAEVVHIPFCVRSTGNVDK